MKVHFEIRDHFSEHLDPGPILGTSGVSVDSPDVFISGGTFRNKME